MRRKAFQAQEFWFYNKRTSLSPAQLVGASRQIRKLTAYYKATNLSSITSLRKAHSVLQQAGAQYPINNNQSASEVTETFKSLFSKSSQRPNPWLSIISSRNHQSSPTRNCHHLILAPSQTFWNTGTSRSKIFSSFLWHLHCFKDQGTAREQKETMSRETGVPEMVLQLRREVERKTQTTKGRTKLPSSLKEKSTRSKQKTQALTST